MVNLSQRNSVNIRNICLFKKYVREYGARLHDIGHLNKFMRSITLASMSFLNALHAHIVRSFHTYKNIVVQTKKKTATKHDSTLVKLLQYQYSEKSMQRKDT